jgi:hypothetical protein
MVILPSPALELLSTLPRVEGNQHVIPGQDGSYLFNVWKFWHQLRSLADCSTSGCTTFGTRLPALARRAVCR